MIITSRLFEAYLKCPTKCSLRSIGEAGIENAYADLVRTQNESYRNSGVKRLLEKCSQGAGVTGPLDTDGLKTAKWRLAVNISVSGHDLESTIHAIERGPSEGRSKTSHFIPIRFVPTNKLAKDDKLLLAFDALALSAACGKIPLFGKIIHGSKHVALRVKLSGPMATARSVITKIAAQQAGPTPPRLILNKHCAECEFQPRCREIAIEKDDLSLLSNMSKKDCEKQRSKGIFSVTQLAYTFRPRRRARRFASKPERFHHELKALAIRDKKIHVAGKPEFRLNGTPVYLDVEGIPDSNFYYLIGLRFKMGDSYVQHSFWADNISEENRIWTEFLHALKAIDNPMLIHYGSYETVFFKQMRKRYGEPIDIPVSFTQSLKESFNLLSIIYAQIYFPTYSNGLKDVARHLGFSWSDSRASGAQSLVWRYEWEMSHDIEIKQRLITYNAEDCQALELVACTADQLCHPPSQDPGKDISTNAIYTDSLKPESPYRLGTPSFSIPGLEYINKASYWNYQQDRVYVRSGQRPKQAVKLGNTNSYMSRRINKVIKKPIPTHCPSCNKKAAGKPRVCAKVLYDILFSRFGVKRWVVKYEFKTYWCWNCGFTIGSEPRLRTKLKYGWNLVAYLIYQIIELHIPQRVAAQSLNRLFGFDLKATGVTCIKTRAAESYEETQQGILKKLIAGNLLHVDETKAIVKGKTAFVWVFTNLQEVAFVYADSREGDMLKTLLREYKGVLVSDFYAVYDSIDCPQQKCLIHLVRDLNDDLLTHPFNDELKQITNDFALLLKPAVETVDRYGLKSHFLRKHNVFVRRFYKRLDKSKYQSEIAIKYQKRFDRNREKLFTFLNYDGVPWNNNNAEHAIKAFAAIRNVIGGVSSEAGLKEYLVLLSVCETCKNKGIDYLEFLRSEEKDIDTFVASKRGRNQAKIAAGDVSSAPDVSQQPSD